MKKALVLLNMGGPNNLDEVKIFLTNMFNDKNIIRVKSDLLRKFIAIMITTFREKEAKENYRVLGGKSPIVDLTKKLIEKLEKKIGDRVFVTFAMRYTPPFSKEVIEELKNRNIEEVFLFPLYPQFSTTTTKSSLEEFYQRAKELNFTPKFFEIERFYKSHLYNEAIIERIEEAMGDKNPNQYILIFSAHSLPKKIIESGDSYQKEIIENVEILSNLLNQKSINFKSIELAYQSKLGPVKWLEPSLEEKLKSIKEKKIIIYPLSFIIDNSETEFELSIEYKELAKELNFEDYIVAKALNDSEKFQNAIVEILKENGFL